MLDNRWPHLCEVSSIPNMDQVDRARMRRACERITARTDFKAAYNKATGCLHFYLGSPEIGAAVPSALARVTVRPGINRTLSENRVEAVCKTLQRGRVSRALKDREMEYAENAQKSDIASLKDKKRGEAEKVVEQKLRRTLNRRGMSSRFRPSAVVDGLKGKA